MAPPKVDLSSKEAKKAMEAGETKVPIEPPPPVVTVNCEKKCKEPCKKRRCCAACVVGIFIAVIVVVGITFLVKHAMHRRGWDFRCGVGEPGHRLPAHVRADEKNKLIYVSTPQKGNYHAVEALHDYNRKMMVFKDTTNMRCYIDTLDTEFYQDYDKWASKEDYRDDDRHDDDDDEDEKGRHHGGHRRDHHEERRRHPQYMKAVKPVDNNVLHKVTGQHIAAHCQGVETMWVVEVKQNEFGSVTENVVRLSYNFNVYIKIDKFMTKRE